MNKLTNPPTSSIIQCFFFSNWQSFSRPKKYQYFFEPEDSIPSQMTISGPSTKNETNFFMRRMTIHNGNHHLQDDTICIPEHSSQLQQPTQHSVQQRIWEDMTQGTWNTLKIHMAVLSWSILLLHRSHRILPVTEEKYVYIGHITHTQGYKTYNSTPTKIQITNCKIKTDILKVDNSSLKQVLTISF